MTTATAELCGHRWAGPMCFPPFGGASGPVGFHHDCERPAHHEHDMLLRHPQRCRCRCGATTTREDER